jgi:hypothetical protein
LEVNRATLSELLRPHLQSVFGDPVEAITFEDVSKNTMWRTKCGDLVRQELDTELS